MKTSEDMTPLKHQRIVMVYEREPELEAWAFAERFGVSEDTCNDIMASVDKRLQRPMRREMDHEKRRRNQ